MLLRPSVALPRAAGATWNCLTPNAPWAIRRGHSTVIDAGGNIYLMGGYTGNGGEGTNVNDVWVSTDKGADRTRAGYLKGTKGTRGVRV